MPLIFEKIMPSAHLGVWHILETESELRTLARCSEEDLQKLDSYKNESRRKQWLACRAVLCQLIRLPMVAVDYDEHGKPSMRGSSSQISFSHTKEFAAVLVNKTGSCGVDIEKVSLRFEKVAGRFLQVDENEHIRQLSEGRYNEGHDEGRNTDQYNLHSKLLCLYWCAKEALYKFYGKPTIDLKNDIYIRAFDYFCNSQTTFTSRVTIAEGVRDHELQFERIKDHMLVFTIQEKV